MRSKLTVFFPWLLGSAPELILFVPFLLRNFDDESTAAIRAGL